MRIICISFFLSSTLFSTCQSGNNLPGYLEIFEQEAQQRGLTITVSNYKFLFSEDMDIHKTGYCQPENKRIILNAKTWRLMDTFQREALIYHELAHCALGRREHRNDQLPHGECMSILSTAESGSDCSINFSSKAWRKYYFDELFQINNSGPKWYQPQVTYLIPPGDKNIVFDEKNIPTDSLLKYGCLKQIDIDTSRNFQVEISYEHLPPNKDVSFSLGEISIHYFTKINQVQILNLRMRARLFQKKISPIGANIKFSIRKIGAFVYFFLDQNLIHQMDYSFTPPRQKIGGSVFNGHSTNYRLTFAYL